MARRDLTAQLPELGVCFDAYERDDDRPLEGSESTEQDMLVFAAREYDDHWSAGHVPEHLGRLGDVFRPWLRVNPREVDSVRHHP
jgi:hypothetical protein